VTLTTDLLLVGRYRLVAQIAVGGMGEVWRADDLRLRRPVAVKSLRSEYSTPAFRERLRAEARHTASLAHPGVAQVYEYVELPAAAPGQEPAGYLVMEYVDGEPLSTLLARVGRLPAASTMDIIGQAALGLQAAHDAGIVHRDVKPGNLLLRADGVVKVTDFGIAWAGGALTDPLARTGETGLVIGTAYYLSPEQAAGRKVTPASDVYALGVVAYECLAGRRPFLGSTPLAVAMAHVRTPPPPLPDDVPEQVRDLVAGALAKDPLHRPPSAGHLGRAALALRGGPGPTGPQPVAAAPARRHRSLVASVLSLLTVIALALLLRGCAGTGSTRDAVPSLFDNSSELSGAGTRAPARTVLPGMRDSGAVTAAPPVGGGGVAAPPVSGGGVTAPPIPAGERTHGAGR